MKELKNVVNEENENLSENDCFMTKEELVDFIPTETMVQYEKIPYKRVENGKTVQGFYREIAISDTVVKSNGLKKTFEARLVPAVKLGERVYNIYQWLDFVFEGDENVKLYFKRVEFVPEGEKEPKIFYKPFVVCETDLGYIKIALKTASLGDNIGFELIKQKYINN